MKQQINDMMRKLGGERKSRLSQASTAAPSYLQPCLPSEARLTIVQITDVYTLDNFAALKTMLQTIRAAQGEHGSSNKVVSMVSLPATLPVNAVIDSLEPSVETDCF